jgi:DNA-binding Xre family transcriptional regulator
VPTKKAYDIWTARRAAKQQRVSVGLQGLWYCRIAAALTQRELADLIGSSQTAIADLEDWDTTDLHTLKRLCETLRLAPDDLVYRDVVDDTILQATQGRRAKYGFGDGDAKQRRQVNRIKKGAHAYAPGTVFLRGLKERRLAAGLSQRKLAEMIGSNQATVQQLETVNRRGAYMKTIRRLCQALEVSPADLICRGSNKRGGEGR